MFYMQCSSIVKYKYQNILFLYRTTRITQLILHGLSQRVPQFDQNLLTHKIDWEKSGKGHQAWVDLKDLRTVSEQLQTLSRAQGQTGDSEGLHVLRLSRLCTLSLPQTMCHHLSTRGPKRSLPWVSLTDDRWVGVPRRCWNICIRIYLLFRLGLLTWGSCQIPPINYVTPPKVGMATGTIPFPKISLSPGTTTPILLSLNFDP